MDQFRKAGKRYIVKCTHCGHVYSWSPELDIVEGQCTDCRKIYNCEFGIIEDEHPGGASDGLGKSEVR